jgi:phage terminase small subunit
MNKKLTQKQLAFCSEYILDFNGTASYIRAGYSAKGARTSASHLLANPNIQTELKKQIAARAKRTKITGDAVVDDLRYLADMALGREPTKKVVLVDGKMIENEVLEVNGSVANAALASLGKHCGIFEKDNQSASNDFILGIRALILTSNALPKDQDADIARQRAERDALTQDSE